MAYDRIDKIVITRINEVFQKKEIDLKKESKLSSALSKSLLCIFLTLLNNKSFIFHRFEQIFYGETKY